MSRSTWLGSVLLGAAVCASAAAAQEPSLARVDTIHVDVASRAGGTLLSRSRVVQVLTAAQLEQLPVHTVNEALAWMGAADVMARSPMQADLGLRGSTFEEVLVLVDGVRMSDPQTGHYGLDLTVPLDRIERIELLAGPASALYGADAMGGVVNIVTRDGGAPASAHVEGGTFDSWRAGAALDGATPSLRGGLGGEWSRSDGFRTGTDYESTLVQGRGSAAAGAGRLFAQGGYAHRDYGADHFYAPYPSYERTRTTTASAGWSGDLVGGFSAHPMLSYRRHYDDFTLIKTNPAAYENVHTSTQQGGELLLREDTPGALGVALALGGEVYQEKLESDNVATTKPADALGDRSEGRAAGFGEISWSNPRATATAGLRDDWHDGFGSFWSPSISASAELVPALRVRGSWGRSFRAPTWTERFYNDPTSIGNPNLKPERSWTGEVGVDVALPTFGGLGVTGGVLRGTLYRRQGDDLIDWVKPLTAPASAPSTATNIQSARYDGLELSLDRVEVRGFQLNATVSTLALDATATGLTSRYALKPLTARALVGVARPLFDHRLVLSADWQRNERRGESSYHLFGAHATVRLPYGAVDVIGTNLADEAYNDITGFAAQGRALTVGYRVELK